MPLPPTVADRLAARLVPEGECLVYAGARDGKGYGAIGVRHGVAKRAHRVAYELAHGPIPDGLVIMHVCDNPPCCRLEHLRLGTQAENNADRDAKGRTRSPKRTHCAHGHEFDEDNTSISRAGRRRCRACMRRRGRERYARNCKRKKPPAQLPAACIHGHELIPENVYIAPSGKRFCRTCQRASRARTKAKRRGGTR